MIEQSIKIKKLIDTNLSIVYKRLSIEKILYKGKWFIQVDCDRFDLAYSKLYSIENIDFAISKFTGLLARYLASELRHGE
jgi:hypothetical protein